LVIWMVAFFSIIAMALSARGAASLSRTARFMQDLKTQELAKSAIEHAHSVLEADQNAQSAEVDGLKDDWAKPYRFEIDNPQSLGLALSHESEIPLIANEAIVWRMTDEERKLPLNTMSQPMLTRFIVSQAELVQDKAAALADAVLDWRDEDSDAHPEGAEDFDYRGGSGGYECKDAPFENVEELLLVRGMTPAVYARLAPFLTVYGTGRLNINTADEAGLSALGLSSQGIAGVLVYRLGGDGAAGTADDRLIDSPQIIIGELAPFVPDKELALLSPLIQEELLDVKSTAFRITVTAPSSSGRHAVSLTAVINREGDILEWGG